MKFLGGLTILLAALVLQFWLVGAHVYINLAFAAVISFALIFDFWEFLALDLLAVFIVNWEPAASAEILVFALYPILVHVSRNLSAWQAWLKNLGAIVFGFALLYLVAAGAAFPAYWRPFLIDVAGGLLAGAAIFSPLYRWERR